MSGREVLGSLRSLVGHEDPETIYECRRCGTTLDAETESCPTCGAEEIARFAL